jgi:hypothetical protein
MAIGCGTWPPKMPAGDPVTGEGAANWSRINYGVRELIDQILVSHQPGPRPGQHRIPPLDGIKSVTADPASLVDMEAPSDHRPVIARFNLSRQIGLGEERRSGLADQSGGDGEGNDPAGHGCSWSRSCSRVGRSVQAPLAVSVNTR